MLRPDSLCDFLLRLCWHSPVELRVRAMGHGLPELRAVRLSPNRFSVWPLALTFGFPVALVLVWSGPFELGFVGAPLVFLAWGVATVLATIIGVGASLQRAWRRAMSMLPLPLLTLAAFLNLGILWSSAIGAGDYIHFRIMRGYYLDQV